NTNGTPDATFGSAGIKLGPLPAPTATESHSFSGSHLALRSDGSIIVAGTDSQRDLVAKTTTYHPLLMRFYGTTASPLLAAGGAVAGANAARLADAQLRPIVAAAIDRWAAAGLDAASLATLRRATVTIDNLGGAYLGLAYADQNLIRIDDDAAGHGWFVDPT